jgi:hypothetical protein
MNKVLIILVISMCVTSAHAQFLKKLKAKVEQSANEVKAKVKDKAETAPDRVIDHTANKIDTKAESKIDNKENKANSKVDKTVDKVDSIKIKKAKTEEVKDTFQNKTGIIFTGNLQTVMLAVNDKAMLFYNFNNTALLSFYKTKDIFI